VLALGIAIRFLLLGQQSFWDDEINSVTSVSGPDAGPLAATLFNDPHGPLYLLLLRGWIHVFGSAEAPVRALSALLGSIGLVLFYRLARRLLGEPVALLALVLLALSAYHLWYSQEARNYALLFDAGLLAVPAFLDDIERCRRSSFALALLATLATCLANLSGFFLVALEGVYALSIGRRAGYPARRFVLLAALTALLLSPWIVAGIRGAGPLHLGRPSAASGVPAAVGESPPGPLSIPYTFYDFSLGRSLGPDVDELKRYRAAALLPHLWYLVPAGALFALLAWNGWRRTPRPARAVLTPWVVVPVLAMAAVSALNLKAPNSRYALLAFPPYLILLAIGASAIPARAARWGALGGLLLLSLASDLRYFRDPRCFRPDARSAGRLIDREARPGDLFVVYALQDPVRYYCARPLPFVAPLAKDTRDEGAIREWLRANSDGKQRVWLVQCESWWVDRQDRLLEACRGSMTLDSEWRFTKLPVYRFSRRGSNAAGSGGPRVPARPGSGP
jgi:hypothetical protein